MKGKITLYNCVGERIETVSYSNKSRRKDKIIEWMRLIKNNSSGCYFQIEPEVNVAHVRREDGMNWGAEDLRSIPDIRDKLKPIANIADNKLASSPSK